MSFAFTDAALRHRDPPHMQVKEMIKFRRALPEGANLLVTKNTLMVKASEGTKWEPISECCTGMNAWLFVDEILVGAGERD